MAQEPGSVRQRWG
uniref:Uncharacterized protein n=1 Tax=Arundo donax TaxID=35708 RepID=A0A0A9C3B5_ARUDO